MKIIVYLKEVIDPTIDLGYGRVSDALVQKGYHRCLNPADAESLSQALSLKGKEPGIEITLVTIGPERMEQYLRDGLAQGADKAVCILEGDLYALSAYQKATILAKAVSVLGADLVLTGSNSLDNVDVLVGICSAARLDWPSIGGVVGFELNNDKKGLIITLNAGKGLRERVISPLPAVLGIEGDGRNLPYATLGKLLESQEAVIDRFALVDLGISPTELKADPARVAGLSFPKPKTKPAPLDSSLPAFYRILALLQGGIEKRRGEIIEGNKDELINRLFELLVKEEVLKTPRKR